MRVGRGRRLRLGPALFPPCRLCRPPRPATSRAAPSPRWARRRRPMTHCDRL